MAVVYGPGILGAEQNDGSGVVRPEQEGDERAHDAVGTIAATNNPGGQQLAADFPGEGG